MIGRMVQLFGCVGGLLLNSATAQESLSPRWDQSKAVEIVKGLIVCEEKGDQPWDRIPWQTDAREAAELAQKEQKPIFLFFFLKKNSGPAQAPC